MAPLLFFAALLLPFAWFASEFQARLWIRLGLGIFALVGVFFIGMLADIYRQIDANSYYSMANQELITTTRAALEAGRVDAVVKGLKVLDDAYDPSYEWRQNYQEQVSNYSQAFK